jgi:putative tricarboxylic transport membrane protein
MEAILQAFGAALQLKVILMMILGAVVGLVFGAIPGLTYSMGIILVLPLTFNLDPLAAITLLLGVYVGGMTGGSVSAIILAFRGLLRRRPPAWTGTGWPRKARPARPWAPRYSPPPSAVYLGVDSGGRSPHHRQIRPQVRTCGDFRPGVLRFLRHRGISSGKVIKGLISGMIGLLVMTMGMDR